MTTINIGGQRVKVGDEFWSLSQDEQNATVEHIAGQLGVKSGPKPPPPSGSGGGSEGMAGRATRAQREDYTAPTMLESAGRGFVQGGTAGFAEEMKGLEAAGGATPTMQFLNRFSPASMAASMALGGARMLAERAAPSVFGTGGTDAYNQTTDQIRSENRVAQSENPGSYLTGQIGGAVAVPLPAASFATVPRAIATGATLGAVTGAGNGEGLEDRARQAATGGIFGGLFGGAAVPLVKGAEALGGAISSAASGITSRIRGVANPEAEAARRVQMAFAKDAEAGNVISGPQLRSAVDNAQPIIAADMGGETVRALARSAANTSPAGREKLAAAIADRFEGQSERTVDFLKAFGAPEITAAREQLQAGARAANRPAYAKAYQDGAGGIWTEPLAEIASTPLGQQALKDAMIKARNRAPLDGFKPPPNPFVQGEDGVMQLQGGAAPTIQFWDHVQRSLRDAAETGNKDAGALRKVLNQELDRLVPSFNDARLGAAKFFGAEDALDAGIKFAQAGKMNHGEAMSALKRMSPDDQDLFKAGFLGQIIDRVGKLTDSRDVAKAIMQSPDARQRVQMVLGPKGAERLEAFIEGEKFMNATRAAVSGNSRTAQYLAEIGMAGGGAGAGLAVGGDVKSAAAGALLQKGARMGATKIDARVSEKVAEMLASDDPKVWGRAIELASKNRAVLDAISDANRYLAQLSAPQAPNIPVPALTGVPRAAAEDEPQRPVR
jgi:hypothetical protein